MQCKKVKDETSVHFKLLIAIAARQMPI